MKEKCVKKDNKTLKTHFLCKKSVYYLYNLTQIMEFCIILPSINKIVHICKENTRIRLSIRNIYAKNEQKRLNSDILQKKSVF